MQKILNDTEGFIYKNNVYAIGYEEMMKLIVDLNFFHSQRAGEQVFPERK